MKDASYHGSHLTDEEYERRIHKLYSGLPSMPTKEQEMKVRHLELELAIDHRLGVDFPKERREALWAIQQRVEKKRLQLAFRYLFRRFFAKRLVRDTHGLANYLIDEYAKVLTKTELESFFQFQDGVRPVLPIDMGQLKK